MVSPPPTKHLKQAPNNGSGGVPLPLVPLPLPLPLVQLVSGGVPIPLPASQTEVFCSLGSLHHPSPFHHLEPTGRPGVMSWNPIPFTWVQYQLGHLGPIPFTWVQYQLSPGSYIRWKEEASDFSSTARQPTRPALADTRLPNIWNKFHWDVFFQKVEFDPASSLYIGQVACHTCQTNISNQHIQ